MGVDLPLPSAGPPRIVEGKGIVHVSRLAAPVTERAEFLQGTLDLLILRSLALRPLHGWGISKRIRQLSADVLQVNQGSLYPALYRLEDRGLVRSAWGTSGEGRRVRLYTLTAAGRKQMTTEQAEWRRFAKAMEQVLEGT
ncbi:MAG TPA: PadR family transcriptional regulator [Vicinamibacterales bacterium]|nr:PadR family transcriptional regulator [Vicinamibacterales bacterium]